MKTTKKFAIVTALMAVAMVFVVSDWAAAEKSACPAVCGSEQAAEKPEPACEVKKDKAACPAASDQKADAPSEKCCSVAAKKSGCDTPPDSSCAVGVATKSADSSATQVSGNSTSESSTFSWPFRSA